MESFKANSPTHAVGMRPLICAATFKKRKRTLCGRLWQNEQSWNILKSEFQNLENIEKSAIETHDITIQEHGITTGQLIYIDPFIIFREDENPFKVEKREFPMDFGVRSEKIYVTNITIPDGYLVDETPPPKVTVLPENKGKFSYHVTQTGNRLTVVSSIQINERIFMQDEYPGLREFYNRIVAKQSEQVVLKKKGNFFFDHGLPHVTHLPPCLK